MGKNDVIKLTRKIRIGAPGILYLNVELYLVKQVDVCVLHVFLV